MVISSLQSSASQGILFWKCAEAQNILCGFGYFRFVETLTKKKGEWFLKSYIESKYRRWVGGGAQALTHPLLSKKPPSQHHVKSQQTTRLWNQTKFNQSHVEIKIFPLTGKRCCDILLKYKAVQLYVLHTLNVYICIVHWLCVLYLDWLCQKYLPDSQTKSKMHLSVICMMQFALTIYD